jgi:acyl carrier protein
MTSQLQQELIHLVARELNIDPAKINPDVPLIKYSLDSFSLFHLKYVIENRYQLTLFQHTPIEETTINTVVNEASQL